MKKKKIEIGGILEKLREFESDTRYGDRLYAIQENIKFAEAMKSLPRYAWWLLTRILKIRNGMLAELKYVLDLKL